MQAFLSNFCSRITYYQSYKAHLCLLACGFMLSLTGIAVADPPAPTVIVTAGDPGDLNVGDQATAPASAFVKNPPEAAEEGTLEEHWTWSISVGDSDTVYIEHPDAASTTYHCKHDDPGDYSIEVSASVTLHDPTTGQDYGPYSGSDTFGDTDPDPDSNLSASTMPAVATSLPSAPKATPAKKKSYPVALHYRIDKDGMPKELGIAGFFIGHRTLWTLKSTYSKGSNAGQPFIIGSLQEVQKDFYVNPLYSTHWSAPGAPAGPQIRFNDGTFSDLNAADMIKSSKTHASDELWYQFLQRWDNSNPDVRPDNHFLIEHVPPTAKRNTIEQVLKD